MAYAKPVTGVTDCFVIFATFGASVGMPPGMGPGGNPRPVSGGVADAIDGVGHVVADQQ